MSRSIKEEIWEKLYRFKDITDEGVHDYLKHYMYPCPSPEDIAIERKEYNRYIKRSTKKEIARNFRHLCKHTKDFHRTGMWTPYKKDTLIWACSDCGRIHLREKGKSDKWLSMKKSKPLVKAINEIQNTYIVTVEMKRTIKYLADIEVKASSERQARTVANMHYHSLTVSDTKELSRVQDGEPREDTPNNPESYWKTVIKE